MSKYSRGHERDECAKMWRGFWHSTFGILLCWVPLLGLLFSISGFARQVVRMTDQYKKRLLIFIVYGLLSLCISIGAIVYGLYSYAQDPNFFTDAARGVWTTLTGQKTLPGEAPLPDYSGTEGFGGGVNLEGDPGDPDDLAAAGLGGEDDVLPGDKEASLDGMSAEDADVPDEMVTGDDVLADDGFEDEEELPELDFDYEVLDDNTTEVDGLECISYKVYITKASPTDEDLMNLYKDVIFGDEMPLHNVYVYKSNEDFEGEYDVAAIEQMSQDVEPKLTRK